MRGRSRMTGQNAAKCSCAIFDWLRFPPFCQWNAACSGEMVRPMSVQLSLKPLSTTQLILFVNVIFGLQFSDATHISPFNDLGQANEAKYA